MSAAMRSSAASTVASSARQSASSGALDFFQIQGHVDELRALAWCVFGRIILAPIPQGAAIEGARMSGLPRCRGLWFVRLCADQRRGKRRGLRPCRPGNRHAHP